MVFVGDGPDREKLINKARELGIVNDVLFVGMKKNINEWLNCFDMFIFPSLFEGLGIALLEAEANGLPIVASKDVIPAEVKLNSNFTFISLKSSPKIWSSIIRDMKPSGRIPYNKVELNFKEKGWEIASAANKLEELLIQ